MPSSIYRHYKGGLYVFLFVAETHAHNGDHDVAYVSLAHGTLVTRPWRRDSRNADSWCDDVEWPDKWVRARFRPESPDLAALFEPEPARGDRDRGVRRAVGFPQRPAPGRGDYVPAHYVLQQGQVCDTCGQQPPPSLEEVWFRLMKRELNLLGGQTVVVRPVICPGCVAAAHAILSRPLAPLAGAAGSGRE